MKKCHTICHKSPWPWKPWTLRVMLLITGIAIGLMIGGILWY